MQKDDCRSRAAYGGVLLPASAHHRLVQVRDQWLLLSQLAEPRGETAEMEFRITPAALAELFDRQAHYLDEVLVAALDPAP